MNTTTFLLILLGTCLILCFILMLIDNSNNKQNKHTSVEGFDPVIDAIQTQLQNESPDALKSTVQALQQRLIDYGYAPDLNTYVKKTELGPNDGKCLVNKAEDRDKYISKSDVPPPGPRIDLSQYVKKSSIPPEKVCPPAPEIDYSAYVKKSTLPPNTACAPCIAPKVKVSAGLCRECPPAPSCPPPERCPDKKCPEPAPCPAEKKCPEPAPCPTMTQCKTCDEIRYIKVPSVITKTVMVDANGKVISQKVDSGNTNPTMSNTPSGTQIYREDKLKEREERLKEREQEAREREKREKNRKEREEKEEKERKEREEREKREDKYRQMEMKNKKDNEEIGIYKENIDKYKEELRKYKEHQNQRPFTTQACLTDSAMQSNMQTPQTVMESTNIASSTNANIYTNPSTTNSGSFITNMFGMSQNQIPTTTFPQRHTCNTTRGAKKSYCSACELNSEFKAFGIYGMP